MSDDHDDFAFEPLPGLPERLPQGETMLWQGSPDWRGLAISAFHVRKVTIYFGLLLAWQIADAWRDGAAAGDIAVLGASTVGLGFAACAILCALAWFYARGTIYTLTTRRIVIRSGLALPVTLNLPLALIDTAAVARQAAGSASIALAVARPNRIAWLVLWPNVKPWTFTDPQPLLRNLPDADAVAPMLAKALEADGGGPRVKAARPLAASESDAVPAGATMAA